MRRESLTMDGHHSLNITSTLPHHIQTDTAPKCRRVVIGMAQSVTSSSGQLTSINIEALLDTVLSKIAA